VAEGRRIVDIDLAKFFDRVNHDILMARLARHVADKRLLRIVRRLLAGDDGDVRRLADAARRTSPLANPCLDQEHRTPRASLLPVRRRLQYLRAVSSRQ
jgi:hypothetical protein